eukprot:TRINITY_DN5579_c0_g1_i1.p1 TRINITY_DN5579_c0_g1~~TRINITY_DN5579_c0_g1_i1.p1  ORF type:complete len:435 (+),score=108.66 TRINITY_DN5579_c0_g1_i1:64-1368(+)
MRVTYFFFPPTMKGSTKMKSFRVISGGTHGADLGGMIGAKLLGLPTGGVGHYGADKTYGFVQGTSTTYAGRDRENVDSCDAVIALNSSLPNTGRGTEATVSYALTGNMKHPPFQKPADTCHEVIEGNKPVLFLWDAVPENMALHSSAVSHFLQSIPGLTTLLVAGVSEKTVPGAQGHMKHVLVTGVHHLMGELPPPPPPKLRYSHYLVMDFEASGHCRDSMKWEIVEFPCVVVDAATLEPVAEYHKYVRPTTAAQLSDFCKESCGITQQQVDEAHPIDRVLKDFIKWVGSLSLKGDVVVVTCGNYDLRTALRAEVLNKKLPTLPVWLKRWCNIKELFAEKHLRGRRQYGMAQMLSHQKLSLEGRHHSGIDDTRNISKLMVHLIRNSDLTVRATSGYDSASGDPQPEPTYSLPSPSWTPPIPSTKTKMKKKTRVQ